MCWDGDPTLCAESLGEAPFHPSGSPRLGWSLCTLCREFRTSLLSFAPWLNQGRDQGHKTLPQNATFTKISTTALPLGWEVASPPAFAQLQALGCVSRVWICCGMWTPAAPTLHQAPETAQPTAQTHKARSSLPPVTTPRSVGQTWPLPSPQVVSQGPPAAQGHPKPVTYRGPQHSPVSTSATPKLPTAPPTFAPLPRHSPPHPFLPPTP